jgi:transcriptional activator of cad operon
MTKPLRIGDWRVDPNSSEISGNGKTVRLDFRAMRLLLCLAEQAGEVVSSDELLNQVWHEVAVSQDSVYQAVTSLRRHLGDDPKNPAYIETVPRLGYRLIAHVSRDERSATVLGGYQGELTRETRTHTRLIGLPGRLVLTATAALCVAFVFTAFLFRNKVGSSQTSRTAPAATQPQKSVAVLPFLDLTEGMHEETFADGMTEELIDRLSKVRGLQVPAPTSSFYYKGKQIAVGDVAKALGVTYVLDGSVRQSGDMVRVAARLMRADNGYVMWSETYDRSFHDILTVQDDIASEVTKALTTSIAPNPEKKE